MSNSGIEPPYDSRCLSSAEVVPGVLKRCALPTGHTGLHRWVEAIRSDGHRRTAEWSDDKRAEMHDE